MNDISIVLCGAAGQGIQTVEQFLVYLFKNSGYNVYATKEYMSRVRGGQNSVEIRIGSNRVTAFVNRIDIFVPIHKDAMKHAKHRLSSETIIIGDPQTIDRKLVTNPDNVLEFDFIKIAEEIGGKIYANIVAVGTIAGIFSSAISAAEMFFNQKFGSKGKSVVENDLKAFTRGYSLGEKLRTRKNLDFKVDSNPSVVNELLFPGSEAVGMGAIAGGCNFISAYPMSPSTAVLIFLAQHSNEFEIVIDQAEDEIAAINKAIGAWYAGARAIASSSGGGISLMNEGISLAGISESPLVIHIAQRPGPGTGLPTRTGQEDLKLAVYAGHGEFPRIIYAPGTLEQGFYLTQKAFEVADKYQIPVFILTDAYYIDTYYNIENLNISNTKIEHHFIKTKEGYKRYRFTKNGLSPRGIPSYGDGLVRVDSDEHDEFGHITEDLLDTRTRMVEKRLRMKAKLLEETFLQPEIVGSNNYKTLVICWGSNFYPIKEAIEKIGDESVAMLHFQQVYPIPKSTNHLLEKAKKVLIIENNATGQLANLIKLETNFEIKTENKYLKYSGEPTSVEEIADFIKSRTEGDS